MGVRERGLEGKGTLAPHLNVSFLLLDAGLDEVIRSEIEFFHAGQVGSGGGSSGGGGGIRRHGDGGRGGVCAKHRISSSQCETGEYCVYLPAFMSLRDLSMFNELKYERDMDMNWNFMSSSV